MDPLNRLQIKLRLTRVALNMTQQEVARKLSISLRTYQRIEANSTPVDIETLYKLSKVFELDFTTLTSPEIKRDDCYNINFFSSDKELHLYPGVDDDSLKLVKEKVSELQNGKNIINNNIFEETQELKKSSSPLFVSDIKKTVINEKLLDHYQAPPNSPWNLSQNLTCLSNYIRAIEVALRNQLAGFILFSEEAQDDLAKHLHHIVKQDQENILIIGQVLN